MAIVADVMTPNPESVGDEATLQKVAGMMRDGDYGVVPVVGADGALVGIVTDRDMVISALADGLGPETPVSRCMTANPDTVPKDITLEQAAMLMAQRQIRRLPVVDSGRLIGMLSLADIATSAAPDKEKGDVLAEISTDDTSPRETNTYSG